MSARQRRRRENRRRRHRDSRRLMAAGGLTAGATLAMSGVAQAAPMTFTVGSLDDTTGSTNCATATNTDCTLRQAITDAEANSGDDTIVFRSGLTGTIHLGSRLPDITYPTAIQGPGSGQITISGDDLTQLMYVGGGADGIDVSISGLTLANGLAQSPPGERNGGAIFNYNADLTVTSSVLTGNRALGSSINDGYGGAICTCSGEAGSLTIRNSTVSGNTAGGSGGGVYTDSHPLYIEDSTFSGNHSYFRGGAISVCCAIADSEIENSTLAGNSATSTDYGQGGGIFATYGDYAVTLIGTTVAGNSGIRGGGVFSNAEGPVILEDTIVANNAGATLGPDLAGPVDAAFSLIRNTTDATVNETVPGSDIIGTDPLLGALANNGGQTQTMAPLCGSPAIDKGSAFSLTEDQRGLTRPVELPDYPNSTAAAADGSDIGAVELQTSPGTVCTPPASGGGPPAAPVKKKKKKCKKKKKHKRSAESAKKKKCKKKKKKK
jgi:hypothetical protein